jgi:trimethylamine--corrinoid protein Co-methyltransferase
VPKDVSSTDRTAATLTLDVFSDDGLEELHRATLAVLERTGVYVQADDAIEILVSGGCRVDRETSIVSFPPDVVEEALRVAPATVRFAGRSEEFDVVVGGDRIGFQNFGIAPTVVDPETRERRPSTKGDVADAARLCDALPEIDIFEMAMSAEDMPPATANVHSVEAAFAAGRKPVCAATLTTAETEACIEMAATIVGGREALRERSLIYAGVCPVSPLHLTRELTEPAIAMAKAGLINSFISEALSGATAPVTVAGTLVVHNAEVLASITLAQLVRRGTPCVYGGTTGPMDLRYATASVGAPEFALCTAGLTQLARRYELPTMLAGM